jgi:hypothetical protein
MSLQPSYAGRAKVRSRRPRRGSERFFLDVSLSRKRQLSGSVFLPRYVAYGASRRMYTWIHCTHSIKLDRSFERPVPLQSLTFDS